MYNEERQGGWRILYTFLFYRGQFRIAAICRCPLRAVLKETRDSHAFMTVGRAFHILVAYERKELRPLFVPNLGWTWLVALPLVLWEWTSLTLWKYLDRYKGILVEYRILWTKPIARCWTLSSTLSQPRLSKWAGVRWVRGVRPSNSLTSLFWEVCNLVFKVFEVLWYQEVQA